MRFFWIPLFFILSCQPTRQDNSRLLTHDEVYKHSHQFLAWFYNNELDSLSDHIYSKEFSLTDLKEFKTKVDHQLGEEVELYYDRIYVYVKNKTVIHECIRDCRFSKSEQAVRIRFGFDSHLNIHVFEVNLLPEEAPTNYSDYKTKTNLRLPFEGEWYVASGGRSILTNGHAMSENQRFAYDFLIKEKGYTFKNEGTRNEDYYCFAKNVIAPGKGLVIKVIKHITENKAGEMGDGYGNTVVIDHRNGEYSVLAHFKKGSIVVEPGDEVSTGQFLGLCGNSGRSGQAHIHYHLQTSPEIYQGEGLPAQFTSYILKGGIVEYGEPIWGQRIQNHQAMK